MKKVKKERIEAEARECAYGGMRVDAWRRTMEGGCWSIVAAGIDLDGCEREVVIPRRDLRNENKVGELLADLGIDTDFDNMKAICKFFRNERPERREIIVPTVGWIGKEMLFMTPQGVIGEPPRGTVYVFEPGAGSQVLHAMRPAGTLEEWKSHVASPLEESDAGVFALSFGFVVPLNGVMPLEKGGIHYVGPSSGGKTTTQQGAASVMGVGEDPQTASGDTMVSSWNATGNGMVALAAAHAGLLLVLDEIKAAEVRTLGETIYKLCIGDKLTLRQDREIREPRTIRTMFLSSGEFTIAQALRMAGKSVHVGQSVRALDIHIGNSVFPGLSSADAGARVDAVKAGCARFYGTAGPAFVECVIRHVVDGEQGWKPEELRAEVDEIAAGLCDGLGLTAPQRRAAKRFALIAFAGEMAIMMGILPYPEGRATEAARTMMASWIASNDSMSDGERALRNIANFVKANPRRFQRVGDDAGLPVSRQAGYRAVGYLKGLGHFNHFLFHEAALREALDGCDYRAAIQQLRALDLLRCDRDGKQRKFTTPDGERIRMVWIDARLLEIVDAAGGEPA